MPANRGTPYVPHCGFLSRLFSPTVPRGKTTSQVLRMPCSPTRPVTATEQGTKDGGCHWWVLSPPSRPPSCSAQTWAPSVERHGQWPGGGKEPTHGCSQTCF